MSKGRRQAQRFKKAEQFRSKHMIDKSQIEPETAQVEVAAPAGPTIVITWNEARQTPHIKMEGFHNLDFPVVILQWAQGFVQQQRQQAIQEAAMRDQAVALKLSNGGLRQPLRG